MTTVRNELAKRTTTAAALPSVEKARAMLAEACSGHEVKKIKRPNSE